MKPTFRKILVIGAGPVVIGQSSEFDYAGTQMCRTLKNEGIEVVVVNDGSTDNSKKVIARYLDDNRVAYIEQKNAGVSTARNCGVAAASGDYITFLDGDDRLSADTIEKNILLIKRQGSCPEWVAFPIIREDEAGNPLPDIDSNQLKSYRYRKEEYLSPVQVFRMYENNQFPPIICSMLFKTDFLTVQFTNGRFEDTIMFLELLQKKPSILLSPYGGYYYIFRESSFINTPFSAEKWVDYTQARLKSVQTGLALMPDERIKREHEYTKMYYNLKYVKFKNRRDPAYSKPLELLIATASPIRKNLMYQLKYALKCVVSMLKK